MFREKEFFFLINFVSVKRDVYVGVWVFRRKLVFYWRECKLVIIMNYLVFKGNLGESVGFLFVVDSR